MEWVCGARELLYIYTGIQCNLLQRIIHSVGNSEQTHLLKIVATSHAWRMGQLQHVLVVKECNHSAEDACMRTHQHPRAQASHRQPHNCIALHTTRSHSYNKLKNKPA